MNTAQSAEQAEIAATARARFEEHQWAEAFGLLAALDTDTLDVDDLVSQHFVLKPDTLTTCGAVLAGQSPELTVF